MYGVVEVAAESPPVGGELLASPESSLVLIAGGVAASPLGGSCGNHDHTAGIAGEAIAVGGTTYIHIIVWVSTSEVLTVV